MWTVDLDVCVIFDFVFAVLWVPRRNEEKRAAIEKPSSLLISQHIAGLLL